MKKVSILELLIMNIVSIIFVSGLIILNVSIYMMYEVPIGLLATGGTLVIVALILNYEQSQSISERR